MHVLARTLTRDVELHGQTLPKGARVLLLLAALPAYHVGGDGVRWFRTPAVRGPAELPLEAPSLSP